MTNNKWTSRCPYICSSLLVKYIALCRCFCSRVIRQNWIMASGKILSIQLASLLSQFCLDSCWIIIFAHFIFLSFSGSTDQHSQFGSVLRQWYLPRKQILPRLKEKTHHSIHLNLCTMNNWQFQNNSLHFWTIFEQSLNNSWQFTPLNFHYICM